MVETVESISLFVMTATWVKVLVSSVMLKIVSPEVTSESVLALIKST
jgi:hypothetical protein